MLLPILGWRRVQNAARWAFASYTNRQSPGFDFLMLKKLEPMIQLNSQETTETTELHPVTALEQGRREDGKTGGL